MFSSTKMVAHGLWSSYHPIITIFFILILVSKTYCEDDKDYTECEKTFDCGRLKSLSYPFWGGTRRPQVCGHADFELKSCEDDDLGPIMARDTLRFSVLNIDPSSRLMTLKLVNFEDYICPNKPLANSTDKDSDLFGYDPPNLQKLNLLYNCTPRGDLEQLAQYRISCAGYDTTRPSFYGNDSILRNNGLDPSQCSTTIEVPISTTALGELVPGMSTTDLDWVLGREFDVSYENDQGTPICQGCMDSKGICGANMTDPNKGFMCLCHDRPYNLVCPTASKFSMRRKLRMALAGSICTIIIISIIFFFFWYRRKKRKYVSIISRSIKSSVPSSKAGMEKRDIYNGVHLFTYEELEEATKNFDEARELGDGGFGTVYYGKLQDGRDVAVKRLYENNYRRVEQFMNEVDILTRLRHPNLVSLYGCTSRHSRELLLVYEYIPNGTLADHLHGERAKPGALPWSIRMNIAVETASALAYLHASVIVHRDVKTNNILIDENFSVKVADFGLSRLFPLDVTHVSTAPQGTPGYVDPEYHQCYQLTDKSDVYSFGVVLIELISSMPAVDISRHRHEINLSNMAINKILGDALHELIDPSLGFESDYAVRKMISAVAELAFQCLQSSKELRPSMEKVLEILKEIQNRDYSVAKAEEMNIPSDDIVLLKKGTGPVTLSPDSVTVKWISTSTTPSASG